jgi:hypothetical protein
MGFIPSHIQYMLFLRKRPIFGKFGLMYVLRYDLHFFCFVKINFNMYNISFISVSKRYDLSNWAPSCKIVHVMSKAKQTISEAEIKHEFNCTC